MTQHTATGLTGHQTRAAKPAVLGRMFGRDSLKLAFVVGVLPNILFLAASPFYLAERLLSPLFYLLAALAMLFLPRAFGWLAFALAAVLDLGLIISFAFHLKPTTAFSSLAYIATIDVSASLFYVIFIGLMAATAWAAAALTLANRARFRAASPIPVALVAFALMAWDKVYTFPYFQKTETGFESALSMNGMTAPAIADKGKNLLVVMVEGLGAFKSPEHRKLFTSALTDGLAPGTFSLDTGMTSFFGSTTGAASRELCGRWGDYVEYLQGGAQNCLPRQLADAGYETAAYHGFGTRMFKRDNWYPKIGFQKLEFMDEIAATHPDRFKERCGSVFKGLCDDEVGQLVHEDLVTKKANPKFIYWLTLNTHIPYRSEENDRLDCENSPAITNRTVCDLTGMWLKVFDQVNAIARDPALPPTDIMVVGDHHTPLWERDAKDHFVLGKVDWYILRDQRSSLESF